MGRISSINDTIDAPYSTRHSRRTPTPPTPSTSVLPAQGLPLEESHTQVSSYTYDGTSNRITTAKDAGCIIDMSNTYNADSRIQHQTLAEGQEYSFAHTTTGTGAVTATKATQPGGAVRRVEFDSGYGTSDQPGSVTDALGRKTTLTYD